MNGFESVHIEVMKDNERFYYYRNLWCENDVGFKADSIAFFFKTLARSF